MLMEVSVGMRRAGSCHIEAGKKRAQISKYPLSTGYQYFRGPYWGTPPSEQSSMTLVTELSLRGIVGAYVTFFVQKEKLSETTRRSFLIYIKLQNHAYPRIAPQSVSGYKSTSTRSNSVDFYRIGTASRGPSLVKRPWPDGAAAPPLTVSRLTTDPCRARLYSCQRASKRPGTHTPSRLFS